MKNIGIHLLTKPYVDHFLKINYGNPVILPNDLFFAFRSHLQKPDYDVSNDCSISVERYRAKTIIAISEDDMVRYGIFLTNKSTIEFGKIIEQRTKFFAGISISVLRNIMSQKDAIYTFQEQYGFTEDIWPYESIKKFIQRQRTDSSIDVQKEFIKKIQKIFMENLSDLGTVSNKLISSYENC